MWTKSKQYAKKQKKGREKTRTGSKIATALREYKCSAVWRETLKLKIARLPSALKSGKDTHQPAHPLLLHWLVEAPLGNSSTPETTIHETTQRRDIPDSEPHYQEMPLEKELRINRRNKPPFRAAFPIDHLALEEDCRTAPSSKTFIRRH